MASIEPFIHHKIVILHEDAPTVQAARAMCEHRIGCVMVADHKGHLVGIVTDRDLVCRPSAYPPSAERRISEVMTKSLVTIDEYARVADVAELMETHGIRRIPVVRRKTNGQERCVGMVTLDDLVASRSIDHVRLSRIVQSQIFRRKSAIFGKAEAIRARAKSMGREEETLRRFYRTAADKMGLAATRAEPIVKHILTDLVQRLNYTAAAHFIVQLPRALQDELIELPAGPDRTITVKSMTSRLAERFGFDQSLSKMILNKFWTALQELMPAGNLNHVLDQLPLEFQKVFTPVLFEAGGDDIAV